MWFPKHLLLAVLNKGRHALLRRPPGSLPEPQPRSRRWRSHAASAHLEGPGSWPPLPDCRGEGQTLDSLYTAQQRAEILQLLNTAPESELATVKLLRGRKSANIVEYRRRNGPFPDLESVVNVPRLKYKTALVVFNFILSPLEQRERRRAQVRVQPARFVKPDVDRGVLEEANRIVSVVCGTNKIAWAQMDRSLRVQDWQQEECSSFMNGTYMASAYLEDTCGRLQISAVVSRIPEADFFVVEKPGISLQNTALFPVTLHLRTVEAMLFALLGARWPAGGPPRVLNMTRAAVGRHFGLLVGDARTSGGQLVRQLLVDSVARRDPRVTFPPGLAVRYRKLFQLGGRNRGEELCDALLQALAFYELLRNH
nr:PREDICTED: transcription elongation factor, mitochondrial isoform X1 [Lepisosteus oculatus]